MTKLPVASGLLGRGNDGFVDEHSLLLKYTVH